ncbi:YtxH domain-containing protein [Fundicoccus culcitae]|uniref:YtxH domain-containing protein n=1 Tax=Fundicoccus culcitae TaxID=2969821 RepID=A0ABY5P6D9_9LACT|nr:YtxH domain-containing protein [Fundicoccus culcitae]UUX33945.1 YtxH domain-containing protein [Fundicoccus culcitae]
MAGFKSGFLWGAVFGGMAGLMNAPASGRETRQNIKDFIDQTTDDVNDVRFKVDNLKMAIERLSTEGLSSASTASKDIQVSVQHFQEETKPRIRRIKEKAEKLQESIDENVEKFNENS